MKYGNFHLREVMAMSPTDRIEWAKAVRHWQDLELKLIAARSGVSPE